MATVERDPSLIRADIDDARAEIARSIEILRHEVRERTDWRHWVRERPAILLGGAAALGFWFGYRGR